MMWWMREAFGPHWAWILVWAAFFSVASAGFAIPVVILALFGWYLLTRRHRKELDADRIKRDQTTATG